MLLGKETYYCGPDGEPKKQTGVRTILNERTNTCDVRARVANGKCSVGGDSSTESDEKSSRELHYGLDGKTKTVERNVGLRSESFYKVATPSVAQIYCCMSMQDQSESSLLARISAPRRTASSVLTHGHDLKRILKRVGE